METERNWLGAFYVGRNGNYNDFLIPKIGQTKRPLTERQKEIRGEHPDFDMLGCVIMFNSTQAEREHVESEVRVHMEKYGKNIKNDHFLIRSKAKKYRNGQYLAFALIALAYAVDCCEREGYPYIVKIFPKNFQKKC